MSTYNRVVAADSTASLAPTVRTRLATEMADPATEVGGSLSGTFAPRLTSAASLKQIMAEGTYSGAIQVIGDSTGVGATRWPYRLSQSIAADHLAYTVIFRDWDGTAQDYAAPVTIQTGTAGPRYLDCVSGSSAAGLDNDAAPHLTGTIDVRVKVAMDDWTPANPFGTTILVSEGGGTGAWGWSLGVNSGGVPKMFYSTDGTALSEMAANAVLGFTDGSTNWLRCVFTPNDGAGNRVAKFYKSVDGVAWTQVGTTITTVGAVTLFDAIAAGSRYQIAEVGTSAFGGYKIYEVDVRDGVAGASIVPILPDLWGYYGSGTRMLIVGAPTLTVVNGSQSGANIAILNDATRRKMLLPNYGQVLTILSTSHNETRADGGTFAARYAEWVTDTRTRHPGAGMLAITQNPETSAAVYWVEHGRRRLALMGFGKTLGIDVLDTYRAFIDYGAWDPGLMGDAVHPNAAGSDLLRDTIKAAIFA